MIKNQSLNYIKQNKKHLSHLSIENIEDYFSAERIDPHEKYLESELRDLLNKTIEKLPPKRQMVFKLIKDEGMSQKEVADLMDISIRTVEVHLKLAVKDVRKIIKDHFTESQKEKPLITKRSLNRGLMSILFFY
jgi:RNA polymerase sigma-70 factor (ECF subfamily)